MKLIPLSRGKCAIVDDGDYDSLSKFKWSCCHGIYAKRATERNGKHRTIYMHRQILGLKHGECADHVNGNGLDNRRSNLRKCDHRQNPMNQKLSRASSQA